MAVKQSNMLIPLAAATPLVAGYALSDMARGQALKETLQKRVQERLEESPPKDWLDVAAAHTMDFVPGEDGRNIADVARGGGIGSKILTAAIPATGAVAGGLLGSAVSGHDMDAALAGAGLGTLGGSVGSYYLAKHLANKRLEAAGYKTASADTLWATEYLSMKRS